MRIRNSMWRRPLQTRKTKTTKTKQTKTPAKHLHTTYTRKHATKRTKQTLSALLRLCPTRPGELRGGTHSSKQHTNLLKGCEKTRTKQHSKQGASRQANNEVASTKTKPNEGAKAGRQANMQIPSSKKTESRS